MTNQCIDTTQCVYAENYKKMKRQIVLIWLVLLTLSMVENWVFSQSAATLVVADGVAQNEYIPVNGDFNDSPQQQQFIYPANMLMDMSGSTISSMTWYLRTLPSDVWDGTYSIRMGVVEEASFQSAIFLPTANMTEVYQGQLVINAVTQQLTVYFTTPYTYTGGNLLVNVQTITGGFEHAYAVFYGINSSNSALFSYTWNGVVGPTIQHFIPKTGFTYMGGSACLAPANLTVTTGLENVETQGAIELQSIATMHWQPRSANAQYQVYCDVAGADLNEAVWTMTPDTFFTFHNLSPNTLYTAYVRSSCTDGVSGEVSYTFFTECSDVISSFPWTEGFEDAWRTSCYFGQQNSTPSCWKVYNGGTTLHSYGDGSFYWKYSQNPTHAHTGQHSAVCFTEYALERHNDWLISPLLGLTGIQQLSFYVRNHVSNTTMVDEISVWISDENAILQAPESDTAVLAGFTMLFQTVVPVGEFQYYELPLAGYSGNRYIAFVRRYAPNAGWNLCLDDITVENIQPCATPDSLVSLAYTNEALLSWEADVDTFNLYYKSEEMQNYAFMRGISLNDSGMYVLTGLTNGTAYNWYVEAICDDGSLIPSAVSTFNTACTVISSVPQIWDFEHNNIGGTVARPLPACWVREGSTTVPYVIVNPYTAYSGNSCLYSGNQAAGIVAVLPQIATDVLPLNGLQLRFYAKSDGGLNANIEVGLMSSGEDVSSFEPVWTCNTLTGNYVEYRVSFANVPSTATYIAFRLNPNNNIYIDDVILEEIPDCDRPTGLQLTAVTSNSATITWSANPGEYYVYYQESGHGAYLVTNDSPIIIESQNVAVQQTYVFHGLNSNTSYSVFVATMCNNGTEIASSIVSFTTDCMALDSVPYTWDFEHNNTENTAYPMQLCWSRLGVAASSLYVADVISMAHSGTHSLYSIYPNNYVVLLPNIDTLIIPLNTLQLSFYAKNNYGRGAMVEVGVLTDPADASTFENISMVYLSREYQLFEIPLWHYSGNGTRLAFRLKSDNDYVVIDDVTLEHLPPCPKPTNLECVSTNSSSVTLTWQSGSDEGNWDLVYGLHGFDPNNAQNIISVSGMSQATVDSLLSSEVYDFYVRANCGEDGVSGWQGLFNVVSGVYFMHAYGTDTLHTCGATIYDNGGPDNDYSNDCDSYLVIYPDDEHSYVEISGILIAENSMWDYLVVYDGVGVGHEMFRSNQDGFSTLVIPTITSHSGPLTIYFHSDNSVTENGFVIYTSCVSCVPPRMEVSAVGLDSAVIVVERPGGENPVCQLVYGLEGFNPEGVQPIILSFADGMQEVSVNLTGLSLNTSYEAYLRVVCDSSYSEWSHAVEFSTLPFEPAQLPYRCNFENSSENVFWSIVNGTQTNSWYIDDATNYTPNGSMSLYISADNGVSNTYQTENSSVVWAYRDITFSEGEEFLLSFDWRCYGEGYNQNLYDYLTVYIGRPVGVAAGEDEEPDDAVLIGRLCQKSSWNTAEYVLGAEYSNTTKRLYFLWKNDHSDGSNPPAAIDNILVKAINCAIPADFAITDISSSTAVVGITTGRDSIVMWQLRYGNGPVGTQNIVSVQGDEMYLITGLNPATQYEVSVRSICANGDTSLWSASQNFVTGCLSIDASSLPYICDFESNNFGGTEDHPLPACWSRPETYNYPFVYYSYQDAYNGMSSLHSGTDPVNHLVVLPQIDTSTVTLNSLQLTFHAMIECYFNYVYQLEVGVMTDPNNPSTFVSVATVNGLTTSYSEVEVPLDSYTGSGTNIALRMNATGSSNDYGYYSTATIFIDDVVLNYIPYCRRPNNFVNTGVSAQSVELAWTAGGDETQWTVAVGLRGFDPDEQSQSVVSLQVDTNEITIDNLQTSVAYDCYVRANCDGGNSIWRGPLTVMPGAYIMRPSGIDTVYTCGLTIYDNGGPFDNYSDDCDAILVIYPEEPNRVVELSGTFLSEHYEFDYLVIYDGAGTDGQELYHSHQDEGTMVTIPSVHSHTGPLTVYFHSDNMVNWDGFELHVSCISCVAPEVSVRSIYLDSAVVTWNMPLTTPSHFELAYGPSGFNPETASQIMTLIQNTVTIYQLSPNTSYDVYVRTICERNDYSAWSEVCSFTTLPTLPATIPYTCDFESAEENDLWSIRNGSQTNKWYIGTPASETGNTVLYVSGDNGQTNSYNKEAGSNVWVYRDFSFPENEEFALSFQWKCQGEYENATLFDFLRVYIGDPVNVNAGSNTIAGNATELGTFYLQDSWTEAGLSIGSEYAGTVKRLYFLWHNDYTMGGDPAATIDNINIEVIHCSQPVAVTVSNITTNSVHVTVTPATANISSWQLMYNNTIETVSNGLETELIGLQPSTEYQLYARSICDNGDTSLWSTPCTFLTECGTLGTSSLPYICDFESNNFGGLPQYPLPVCWQRRGSSLFPYVDIFPWAAHQGSGYLFSGMDATNFYVILPEINTSELNINELQLGFYAKLSGFTGSIDVGVMNSPSNTSSFTPLGTISTLSDEYAEFEVPLTSYTGNGSYIALRLNSIGSSGDYGDYLYALIYIDDVVLDYAPDCPQPDHLSQTNVTANSVELTWMGTANSYNVYYREAGTTTYTSVENVTLTNGVYVLSGLSAATSYEWYVASVCANGSVIASHMSGSFTTLCETITSFPYYEPFNTGLGCWVSANSTSEYVYWHTEETYGDWDAPIGPAEGSHFASAYFPEAGNIVSMVSPVFNLTSLQEPYIKFYHIQQDWVGDQDELMIYYKTSPGAQRVLLTSYTNSIYPWRLDSLALPNPSASYQLIFEAHLNWGYGIGVDQLSVYDLQGGEQPPVPEWPVVVTDQATGITQTDAVMHGHIADSGNQGIESRGFEWKQTSGSSYSQVMDTGSDSTLSYMLTNLTANTSYTYRAFVSTTDTTIYGGEIQFITLEEIQPDTCATPTALQVTNISATSAEVSWTAGGDELSWVVEHKLQSNSQWQIQSVNTTQVSLGGLQPSSTYQVRVKAVCDEMESEYVSTSFTTTVGINDAEALAASVRLSPNPADYYIDLYIETQNFVSMPQVEIYNAMGQWIKTVELQSPSTRISLDNMSSGLYFVRISSEGTMVTKKFVKR